MQFLDENDELKNKRMRRDKSETDESIFAQKLASLDNSESSSLQRPILSKTLKTVIFQQIDLDFYEGSHRFNNYVKSPIFRLYGINDIGNSIAVHVHGYFPYIYASLPLNQDFNLNQYAEALNTVATRKASCCTRIVKKIEYSIRQNIYGYENEMQPFLRIEIALPRYIKLIKELVEVGFEFPGVCCQSLQTFESNIDFEILFMTDMNIVGCNWIEIREGNYNIISGINCMSSCQLEIDVNYQNIISHSADGEFIRIAAFRILSFDIECAGRKGVFPEPKHDKIIQIANMVIRNGEKEPFIRNIFTLDTCSPVQGSQVKCFMTEREMLTAWSRFVRDCDPDFITGYNIQNFDLPYLLNRAEALGIQSFPYLGRLISKKTVEKEKIMQSNQMGNRVCKEFNIEGRVVFDLYRILVADYKLRSYTLNSVCSHFLNEEKEHVHHSIITDLQNGNEQTRRRLAVYCLKDAYLPLRLLDKLMCLINYIEMARVTGVPISYLLSRGQQIKVVSQLLKKARELKYIIPALAIENEASFEGATVIEPIRGFYDIPISTLDFSSLYPSIMIAHNLCYSTCVKEPAKLDPAEYIKTPSGNYFAVETKRKGVLPEILKNLLRARKNAKEMMKHEKDPFRYKVLDGRQLALKISANSIYGFAGAQTCKLPCLEISQSVTAFGRQMIEMTRDSVEKKYTIANGYKHDAKVIYGDTDSVMVKFGVTDLSEAMQLGKEAAEFISSMFVSPIKLEFEKCYFPYLLIQKKRYAGLYYTNPEKYDKIDCKGIETVRRDTSPLLSNLIGTCLRKILINRDPHGAVDHAKQTISDLMLNRIDISQLVITKALSKIEYKGKQAHVELAKKLYKRDPGSAPQLGDRIPYVIISGPKGMPSYEKSEDPVYVLENNIPIDTDYYLKNQLSKPLLRIFEPILHARAESILLNGSHTQQKSITVSTNASSIARFAIKKETCLSCKCILDTNKTAVCSHCKIYESQIYQNLIREQYILESKFSRLWAQCQRCQGSLHQKVICTNKDCSIFYMRITTQKNLLTFSQKLERFGECKW